MKYISTRAQSAAVSLSEAIEGGLAQDGGLYVPQKLPEVSLSSFRTPSALPEVARTLLEPFFEEDPLASRLSEICEQAFTFPAPLKRLSGETAVLELFHGPTAAFKDFGARFLAGAFGAMPSRDLRTILVATSGDTGGAVASAFHGKANIEVAILFPQGGVSRLQERQLTCWGGNVKSFAVRGSFDDCQKLVKAAFAERGTDAALPGRHLTSANSINLGRLLPQMTYYAQASCEYERTTGEAPGFVIPSGNVGNAMAAVWVMKMGFPIREILLATNANRVVPNYFASGKFVPAASIQTLANAMDVGNPSNLERLIHLLGQDPSLRHRIRAISVSDEEIRQTIRQGTEHSGQIWCPHTATAVYARGLQNSAHWIIVSTAHPAKFNDIIEPLLGYPAPMPPHLLALLDRPVSVTPIAPDLEELKRALLQPRP